MGVSISESESIIHRLSLMETIHAIDVGRERDGRLLWITVPDSHDAAELSHASLPKFFDPVSIPQPMLNASMSQSEESSRTALTVKRLSTLRSTIFLGRVFLTRRRIILITVVLCVGLGAALFMPTASNSVMPDHTSSPSSTSGTIPQEGNVGADPIQSSIDFAMAGDLPALGSLTGLTRNSFTAVITNRSGDFVLIDVYVTKPAGEKTFATVLLQKAGTQWRMREVFDARG
jgi:hypothetical protein